jgi:hypothetical protein
VGVDRQALPGDPAEDDLTAVGLAEACGCECADDVAAAADAED